MIKPKDSEAGKHIPPIMKHAKIRDEANNCDQITPSTTMTQNIKVAKIQF